MANLAGVVIPLSGNPLTARSNYGNFLSQSFNFFSLVSRARQIPIAGIAKEAGKLVILCTSAETRHKLLPKTAPLLPLQNPY
jgi:hypothetical protein